MPKATQAPRQVGAPWFAMGYDLFMRPLERRLFRRLRRELLAGISGHVLEIGVGTGANIPLFKPGLQAGTLVLTAVEPHPGMARRALQRFENESVNVRLVPAVAETLPFEADTFDQVVGTLVLCSVSDLEGSLREIRRVLKPGGEFRFLEHVRFSGWLGRLQDLLRPGWACLGDGCQLNRRTVEAIRDAGLEIRRLEATRGPFPICRVVWGSAAKQSLD